ncbi:aromatic-ring hydroxylase C-terminal domain-containing protein [Streptomyces sp. NPDC002814]
MASSQGAPGCARTPPSAPTGCSVTSTAAARTSHRGGAGLLREGRGLLLDLVDRAEACDAAAAWTGRVNTVTARTDRVDVDATTLVRALGTWFGQPA